MKQVFLKLGVAIGVFSSTAWAVEAHYSVGIEFKPLPTLMSTFANGQGAGAALELSSSRYDNWVFVASAEAYRGARSDDGMIPDSIENNETAPVDETDYIYQQFGFGVRSYSNRQDDSYYLGGEVAVSSEVQSFEVSDDSYDILSTSYRPSFEFGYRWVWDNGTLFRLGTKFTYVTNIRNRFDGEESELPEAWRETFVKSLEDAESKDDVYANIDLGIGYTF